MKHAGHGFTHTEVEVHNDGSATIEHHHEKGPDHNVKYAVTDLDGLHDGFEDHLRPSENEEDEEHEAAEEKIHPGIHEEVKKIAEGE